MDRVLLDRLAEHRGVAVPDPESPAAVADDLGWRLADLLAISDAAVPAELMPADPTARPQIRNLLNLVSTLTVDELAPIRRYARTLPARLGRRRQPAPPVAPVTFGIGLMRLMLVRNLDTETVCRVIGWPMTLLGRLVRGEFPPEPVWLRHLGDVLDLRPDDLAALAGVPAPPEGGRRSAVGGLIVDVIPLSARAINQVARFLATKSS